MKGKSVFGLIAGAFLILSAGAHSILGWKAMSDQLAQTNGAWAAVITSGDPFIFLFLLPGTLLAIASIP